MSNKHVAVLDVSPSHGFITKVYRDGRTPTIQRVDFQGVDEDNPETFQLSHLVELADENSKKLLKTLFPDTPQLVVMSKLILMDVKKDSSGPRRAGLWWSVASKVSQLGIPLGELTPMTGQYLLTGRSAYGAAGFADAERAVKLLFPEIENVSKFRYHLIAQAVAGATALGWSTPATVDYKKLRALRHTVGNSFPMSIPKTVEEWTELNKTHKDAYTPPKKNKEKVDV